MINLTEIKDENKSAGIKETIAKVAPSIAQCNIAFMSFNVSYSLYQNTSARTVEEALYLRQVTL